MASNYYPINVCNSDGVLQITSAGKTINNGPDAKLITDTTTSDGFKRVADDDPKAIEWKIKLGTSLASALTGVDPENKYILNEFPTGYTLWQSVKGRGGSKRIDTYLYGYPILGGGKTPKRYKSPKDFSQHLLWLAADVEIDSHNCPCKLCCTDGGSVKGKDEATEDDVAKGGKAMMPQDSHRKVAETNDKLALKSPEQNLDSDSSNPFLYRPGELIWFNKGPAWGLAVICKRQVANSKPRYLLQPLSHPLRNLPSQIREQDGIRPWLAWSVPSTTHSQIANMSYDQIPWDRVLRGEFGRGDAEVDGSILAAKQIDASYTLFDRNDTPVERTGEVSYTGMFLGAEKIWVGEPIRLQAPGDDVVVMVVHQMKEMVIESRSSVTIIGDIYKFFQTPTPYKNKNEWPHPDLPPRMLADLFFRNEAAENAKTGTWHEWRLSEPMARRGLQDIKGRWYETRTLLPVLRGLDQFQQEVSQGIISDVGLWMNSRGNGGLVGQRKKNRLDTLGRAVPPDVKISRGLNGPPADNTFPDEQPALGSHGGHGLGGAGVNEFVDISQTSGQRPFYPDQRQQ